MTEPFEGLREELLTAGIKPLYVKRYLYELTQHFFDLTDQLEAEGHCRAIAEQLAKKRMGNPRDLARAMIEQPRLRSLIARYPKTTLLLGPPTILHLAILALVLVSVFFARIVQPAHPDQISGAVTFLCNLGMPALFGWLAVFLSVRQRLTPVWTVAGLVVLAALSSAIDVRTMLPDFDMPGEVAVQLGEARYVALSFCGLLATSLVPYLSLRSWLIPR